MGLTIHYTLRTKLTKPTDVRTLVDAIRQFALDLPLQHVSELKEFRDSDPESEDDEDRWLRIQSDGHLELDGRHYRIPAKRAIAFSTWPGHGCEAANFGFCQYPATIQIEDKRISTKLKGWTWSSFCKTQYASNPKCGGVENFVRCHLLVTRLLDFIQKSGLAEVEVEDEGGYWKQRDLPALVKEVGDWNEFLAGFTGQLQEVHGSGLVAAITAFPNFEHLEAKGLARLEKLRDGKSDR